MFQFINRKKIKIKLTIVIIVLFLFNDFSWAYPGKNISISAKTLQVRSKMGPIVDDNQNRMSLNEFVPWELGPELTERADIELSLIINTILENERIPWHDINSMLDESYSKSVDGKNRIVSLLSNPKVLEDTKGRKWAEIEIAFSQENQEQKFKLWVSLKDGKMLASEQIEEDEEFTEKTVSFPHRMEKENETELQLIDKAETEGEYDRLKKIISVIEKHYKKKMKANTMIVVGSAITELWVNMKETCIKGDVFINEEKILTRVQLYQKGNKKLLKVTMKQKGNKSLKHWKILEKIQEAYLEKEKAQGKGYEYLEDDEQRAIDNTKNGEGAGFHLIATMMKETGVYLEFKRTKEGDTTEIWVELDNLFEKEKKPKRKEKDEGEGVSLKDVGLDCSIPMKNEEGFELDYVVRQNGKVFALRHLASKKNKHGKDVKTRDFAVYEISPQGEEIFAGGLYYIVRPDKHEEAITNSILGGKCKLSDKMGSYAFFLEKQYQGKGLGALLLSAAVQYMRKIDMVENYVYEGPNGKGRKKVLQILPDYDCREKEEIVFITRGEEQKKVTYEGTMRSAFQGEKSSEVFQRFQEENQTITIADWLKAGEEIKKERINGEGEVWGPLKVNDTRFFVKTTHSLQETQKALDRWFANDKTRAFSRLKWDAAIENAQKNNRDAFCTIIETQQGEIIGIAFRHKGLFPFEEGNRETYVGDYSEIDEKFRGKGLGELILAKGLETILQQQPEEEPQEIVFVTHPAEDSGYAPQNRQAKDFLKNMGFTPICFPGQETLPEEAQEANWVVALTAFKAQCLVNAIKEKTLNHTTKTPKQLKLFLAGVCEQKPLPGFFDVTALPKDTIMDLKEKRRKARRRRKEWAKKQMPLFPGKEENEAITEWLKEQINKRQTAAQSGGTSISNDEHNADLTGEKDGIEGSYFHEERKLPVYVPEEDGKDKDYTKYAADFLRKFVELLEKKEAEDYENYKIKASEEQKNRLDNICDIFQAARQYYKTEDFWKQPYLLLDDTSAILLFKDGSSDLPHRSKHIGYKIDINKSINEQINLDQNGDEELLKTLYVESSEFEERFEKELRFHLGIRGVYRHGEALNITKHSDMARLFVSRFLYEDPDLPLEDVKLFIEEGTGMFPIPYRKVAARTRYDKTMRKDEHEEWVEAIKNLYCSPLTNKHF